MAGREEKVPLIPDNEGALPQQRRRAYGAASARDAIMVSPNLAITPGGHLSRSLNSSDAPRATLQIGNAIVRRPSNENIKTAERAEYLKPDHAEALLRDAEGEGTPVVMIRRPDSHDDTDIRGIRHPSYGSVGKVRERYYNSIRNIARNRPPPRGHINEHSIINAVHEDIQEDDDFLRPPNHLLPPSFFQLHFFSLQEEEAEALRVEAGRQSSLVTILAIWNTMMGTSTLSTPWATNEAGVAGSAVIGFVVTSLATYTAVLVLRLYKYRDTFHSPIYEFDDILRELFGWPMKVIGGCFSLFAVGGAVLVYGVLLSNFLFNTGNFFYAIGTGVPISTNMSDLVCPSQDNLTSFNNDSATTFGNDTFTDDGESNWDYYWNIKSVTIGLAVPLMLLSSFDDIRFFTRMNCLGTLSVFFLISLVCYCMGSWGLNVNFTDVTSPEYLALFSLQFPALSGMLALGLFIHNAIITICRNNKNQDNNVRDVIIAYCLVSGTYLFIGNSVLFTFPLSKSCIEDNFLNNFPHNNGPVAFVRLFMFFQLSLVFPLIAFILRNQLFSLLAMGHSSFESNGKWKTLVVNVLMLVGVGFVAINFPSIGTIIRFSGALCGCALIFVLPCVATLKYLSLVNKTSYVKYVAYTAIMMLGFANFVAQFLI